jgi:hypothetical protein
VCIRGNGERAVLGERAGTPVADVPAAFRQVIRWTADELDAGAADWLAAWPATYRLEIDGLGEVLFCHATPRSDTEIFTRLTPADRLRPIFDDVGATVVVCGHTHMQFDRAIGGVRVVNAGSVGMPFGAPGAYWLLLGPGIELRHTTLDLAAAADRIKASSYPDAETFAANHVLEPPTEEAMLERFERVAVR